MLRETGEPDQIGKKHGGDASLIGRCEPWPAAFRAAPAMPFALGLEVLAKQTCVVQAPSIITANR